MKSLLKKCLSSRKSTTMASRTILIKDAERALQLRKNVISDDFDFDFDDDFIKLELIFFRRYSKAIVQYLLKTSVDIQRDYILQNAKFIM